MRIATCPMPVIMRIGFAHGRRRGRRCACAVPPRAGTAPALPSIQQHGAHPPPTWHGARPAFLPPLPLACVIVAGGRPFYTLRRAPGEVVRRFRRRAGGDRLLLQRPRRGRASASATAWGRPCTTAGSTASFHALRGGPLSYANLPLAAWLALPFRRPAHPPRGSCSGLCRLLGAPPGRPGGWPRPRRRVGAAAHLVPRLGGRGRSCFRVYLGQLSLAGDGRFPGPALVARGPRQGRCWRVRGARASALPQARKDRLSSCRWRFALTPGGWRVLDGVGRPPSATLALAMALAPRPGGGGRVPRPG